MTWLLPTPLVPIAGILAFVLVWFMVPELGVGPFAYSPPHLERPRASRC